MYYPLHLGGHNGLCSGHADTTRFFSVLFQIFIPFYILGEILVLAPTFLDGVVLLMKFVTAAAKNQHSHPCPPKQHLALRSLSWGGPDHYCVSGKKIKAESELFKLQGESKLRMKHRRRRRTKMHADPVGHIFPDVVQKVNRRPPVSTLSITDTQS